jgi:hypothetical protein
LRRGAGRVAQIVRPANRFFRLRSQSRTTLA